MSHEGSGEMQDNVQMQVAGQQGLCMVKVVSLSAQQLINKLQNGCLTGLRPCVYEPASNTLALCSTS